MEQETCTVTGYGRPLAHQPDGGNQRGNIFGVTKNIYPHHSPATRLGVLGGRHHGRRDQGGRARAPRPGAVRGAPRRRGVWRACAAAEQPGVRGPGRGRRQPVRLLRGAGRGVAPLLRVGRQTLPRR